MQTVTAFLPARAPYAHAELLGFLAARVAPGVEAAGAGGYRRALRLAGGPALLAAEPGPAGVALRLALAGPGDRAEAERLAGRLFGLDAADPGLVDPALAADPVLAPLVALRPGLRVPGHVDGFELAVRAVLGQQVTVKGAATMAARLAARFGEPLPPALAGAGEAVTHLFPSAAAVAGGDLGGLGLTGARARALGALAAAVADGRLDLDPGGDLAAARAALLALPGIGPWTVEYVAMRALRDPDAIPLGDLGLVKAHAALAGPRSLAAAAARWRPWRATAAMHLWALLSDTL